MAFFSIFKIGLWIVGGILGLFIVKKVKDSKKKPAPPKESIFESKSDNEDQKSRQAVRSKEKTLIYEETVNQESRGSRMSDGEKVSRKELKTLLARVSELIGRGFDYSQIARSLASNSEQSIPKHELAPMIDALNRFLSGYDEKSVKAQEKYNLKAQSDHKAIAELKKGNPEIAIDILQRKLSQLEASAESIHDENRRSAVMAQAAELARHLAVLSAAVDSRTSYDYASQSVKLNSNDIKSLDMLGYYELGYDRLDEAEQHFKAALALDNSNEDKVWVDLAKEGLETINSKKSSETHVKGPDKVKKSVKTSDIMAALDKDHVRYE